MNICIRCRVEGGFHDIRCDAASIAAQLERMAQYNVIERPNGDAARVKLFAATLHSDKHG